MTKKPGHNKPELPLKKPRKDEARSRKGPTKRPMDSGRFSRRVFDVALDGIAIVDEKGTYLDSNQAYCQMLGYSYDEIADMLVEGVITTDADAPEV